jgi:hypothetical protein
VLRGVVYQDIPNEFKELRGNKGYSLRVIEQETTCKALLGEEASPMQPQLFYLPWGEVHEI